jgi:hypothetical protein
MRDDNHDHYQHHDRHGRGGTCFHCGSKTGHDGTGLPGPDEEMDNFVEAIHGAIAAEVNRAGGVHTRLLVGAIAEVLVDGVYQDAMYTLDAYDGEWKDVEELLKYHEQGIQEGFKAVRRELLEELKKK